MTGVDSVQYNRHEAIIFADVNIKPGNLRVKQMKDDLHIADAGMNSTYVSEIMGEFRGKLRAVIIKIILVRRVCSSMVCLVVRIHLIRLVIHDVKVIQK